MVSEPGPGKPGPPGPTALRRVESAILRWAGRLEHRQSGEITCLGQKGRWRGLEPRLRRAAGSASCGRTLGVYLGAVVWGLERERGRVADRKPRLASLSPTFPPFNLILFF